jgi:hypothetical protein
MADPTPPAAPAAATAPAPAAPAPQKDLRNPAMKQLFVKVQEEQRRLGWSDTKLCEFATTTLAALDPYKRFKATTVEFLARLKPEPLGALLASMRKV